MGFIIAFLLFLCVFGLRAGLIITGTVCAALYAWIIWLSS
jgi:hypothetical protein